MLSKLTKATFKRRVTGTMDEQKEKKLKDVNKENYLFLILNLFFSDAGLIVHPRTRYYCKKQL